MALAYWYSYSPSQVRLSLVLIQGRLSLDVPRVRRTVSVHWLSRGKAGKPKTDGDRASDTRNPPAGTLPTFTPPNLNRAKRPVDRLVSTASTLIAWVLACSPAALESAHQLSSRTRSSLQSAGPSVTSMRASELSRLEPARGSVAILPLVEAIRRPVAGVVRAAPLKWKVMAQASDATMGRPAAAHR